MPVGTRREVCSFRLPQDLAGELRRAARGQRRPMSRLVEEALILYLQARGGKNGHPQPRVPSPELKAPDQGGTRDAV